MSYSIATSFQVKNGNKITGMCGSNNVRPFYTSEFCYEDHERFMYDLLSGGLTIDRVRSKIADRTREAMEKVKKMHRERYGEMQERYMYGTKSINPFSLYMIGNVYFSNKQKQKDEFLTNTADLTHVSKKYHTENLVEHAIFKTKWEEYVEFYQMLLNTFFNHIKQ